MTITRRAILKSGAAVAVVLAAGAAGWALTRAPRAARAPWREAAKGFGDPRLDALAYAVLAPSAHNMQPWLIRLEEDGSTTLLCDLRRRLPATDPYDRQITISLGCFLELMGQAAAEQGREALIEPFPRGEPRPRLDDRPVAVIRLGEAGTVAPDPLFGGVLRRRTNRHPFEPDRPVNTEALAGVLAASVPGVSASGSVDEVLVERLRRLTEEAWRIEWSTPVVRAESIEVMRIGKDEINARPDGLYLEGPTMELLHAAGVLTRQRMDEPGSRAFREGLETYARACRSAMAYAWSVTPTNSRRDQLEAGRAWVRMQLAAGAAGLAFHPLSQALQEYPEMSALYREAQGLLGGGGTRVVQMLARLGHAPEIPPAPRWPLESRLLPLQRSAWTRPTRRPRSS